LGVSRGKQGKTKERWPTSLRDLKAIPDRKRGKKKKELAILKRGVYKGYEKRCTIRFGRGMKKGGRKIGIWKFGLGWRNTSEISSGLLGSRSTGGGKGMGEHDEKLQFRRGWTK